MNYLTVTKFETPLAPGVIFHLKKLSHKRRMRYNQAGAEVFAKLNEVERKIEPLQSQIDQAIAEAKIRPCSCTHSPEGHDKDSGRCTVVGCDCRKPEGIDETYRQFAELSMKHAEIIIDELTPIRIRCALDKVEGMEIDGKPATIDSVLEEMPDAVLLEVGLEIDRVFKLSPEEQMAFKSPTTGDAAVAGACQDSSKS